MIAQMNTKKTSPPMAASTAIIQGDMDFFRAATDGGRTWTVVGEAVVAKGQKKKVQLPNAIASSSC